MKNFASLFILLGIILMLSSCGDDDKKPVDPIVGTWKFSSETYEDCDDPSDNSSEIYTCTDNECSYLIFTADGKVRVEEKFGGAIIYTENGTYTTTDSMITVCFDADCEDMTFTISGSTLTFSGADFDCDYVLILKK